MKAIQIADQYFQFAPYPYINMPKETLKIKRHKINRLCAMVSFLIHPYLEMPNKNVKFEKRDMDAIYSFLYDNKVILSVLSNFSSPEYFTLEKKKFIKRLLEENDSFAEAYAFAVKLKSEILKIIKILNENGVETIFIKSFSEIPLDSSNFDILVRKQDISKARRILEDLGFTELENLREHSWNGSPHKFLYRKLYNDLMMSIHLHTEVAWEGIKFLDEEKLWNTIRHVEVDGVKIGFPSCENILLITAAHAFFENKSFSLYDLKCIIESIQKGHDLNWEYIADCTIKGGWFDPFYATLHLADYIHKSLFQKKLVKEEVFKELRKKRKSFRKISLETELVNLFNKEPVLPFKLPKSRIMMAFIRKVLAVSDFAFIKKTEKIFSVSRSYLGRRLKREIPAFLICFSGQDGAGKTTHSKMLQYALKQRGVETIYIWTRGIGLSIEPFLSLGRFLLIGSKSLKSPKYILKRELLLKREPFKTLWAYITIIDALLLLFIKVKIPLLLGQSVICDRHILDTLVDVKCELGKDIHWVIEECAMKLAPRPNLHFILYFTPEEARRSDLNPEIVRCKGHEYLLRFHSRKLILIDTNSSLEQNSIKILTLFIKERYIGKN